MFRVVRDLPEQRSVSAIMIESLGEARAGRLISACLVDETRFPSLLVQWALQAAPRILLLYYSLIRCSTLLSCPSFRDCCAELLYLIRFPDLCPTRNAKLTPETQQGLRSLPLPVAFLDLTHLTSFAATSTLIFETSAVSDSRRNMMAPKGGDKSREKSQLKRGRVTPSRKYAFLL